MYIPIVGVWMPTYPLKVRLYPFVTEIKFTPESIPALCTLCGWCGLIPAFPCLLWEQVAVPAGPFEFRTTSSPLSLCLQNPTINHGDVQAIRTVIIWLRGNLNTSFGGEKNFKCVQATESLMKHKKNPAKWL